MGFPSSVLWCLPSGLRLGLGLGPDARAAAAHRQAETGAVILRVERAAVEHRPAGIEDERDAAERPQHPCDIESLVVFAGQAMFEEGVHAFSSFERQIKKGPSSRIAFLSLLLIEEKVFRDDVLLIISPDRREINHVFTLTPESG